MTVRRGGQRTVALVCVLPTRRRALGYWRGKAEAVEISVNVEALHLVIGDLVERFPPSPDRFPVDHADGSSNQAGERRIAHNRVAPWRFLRFCYFCAVLRAKCRYSVIVRASKRLEMSDRTPARPLRSSPSAADRGASIPASARGLRSSAATQ